MMNNASMTLDQAFSRKRFILAEAAVIETLRRSAAVRLHPQLENAPLIYDPAGKRIMADLYGQFISVARRAGVPIAVCTPTWRANRARLRRADIATDLNRDAVRFMQEIRAKWQDGSAGIFIGGLIGCRNDSYLPQDALLPQAAREFHTWQIRRLSAAGVDFMLAATLPAAGEALGIARAMAETRIPYLISFVINREGTLLDGNSLENAFAEIDAGCSRPPLGYMINCAYPSFLNAPGQPASVLNRLIGFQANGSSLDHTQLDGSATLRADAVEDWGRRMVALNHTYGLKILGGCCGTGIEHLQYLVTHLAGC